jgi:hypothetical protein
LVKERATALGFVATEANNDDDDVQNKTNDNVQMVKPELDEKDLETFPCFIPYNLVTQHSIPGLK